jgi:hypothetical protein
LCNNFGGVEFKKRYFEIFFIRKSTKCAKIWAGLSFKNFILKYFLSEKALNVQNFGRG